MAKIDFLSADISLISHGMEKFCSRLSEAEERISQAEGTINADSRELHIFQRQVKALQEKMVDTENCLRRNNLRILGSWRGELAEQFLSILLGLKNIPPTFVMEHIGLLLSC